MNKEQRCQRALIEIGFSEIEATVYTFLLKKAPVTGYRVSHGIGKPTANTYKAISSLQEKGAIIFEQGDKKRIRPVPPEELIAGLERKFELRTETVLRHLRDIGTTTEDENVYRLSTPEQVLERACTMLARCREIALIDIFPRLVPLLRDDVEAAARRGVAVYVITYEDSGLHDVHDVCSARDSYALAGWPGQQLNLSIDAEEHLLSMFNDDLSVVHQAVWSASNYLSCLQHNAIAMEYLVMTSVRQTGLSDLGREAAAVLLGRANPLGLQKLNHQFGRRQDD